MPSSRRTSSSGSNSNVKKVAIGKKKSSSSAVAGNKKKRTTKKVASSSTRTVGIGRIPVAVASGKTARKPARRSLGFASLLPSLASSSRTTTGIARKVVNANAVNTAPATRNASNSNAAAASNSHHHRGRDMDPESIECRRRARIQAGKECLAKAATPGGVCEITAECAPHGVGKELWPIDKYIEGDQLQALMNDRENYNWKEGRRCINKQIGTHYAHLFDECNNMAKKNGNARSNSNSNSAK
jgi:hypothetical protein